MTHSKQAAKRVRLNTAQRERNKAKRTAMRGAEKKVRQAADAAQATAALTAAAKKIDVAAKHGVIHKNAAARRKSRLAKAANKLAAAR
jgi:small subunit ribosomal protein S20